MNNTYKTNKTDWRRLVRSILFVALLLGGNVVAQTDYVFMYNNYIFGQTTSVSTDFIPNNCVYTGTSGSTFRNGNGYYIVYANQSVNFSTSSGSNLTINNNYLYYNNTYYLRYSGSANNNQGGWQFRNNYNVQATVYTVTTSSHIESFSISGDATISATGTNSSYTHTNANYYDIYSFNSLTYYSTDPSAAASTTAPTSGLPTLTTGYTWSLSSNSYATVNTSTGAITVNSLPASDQNVTLTCSVTRNGVTQTANKTITIEGPKVDPTGISITSGDAITAYVGNTSNITYNLTPSPCYNNVTFSSANTGIASVNGSGVVTGVATGTTTITVTALKINGTTTSALTKTVSVTVKDKVATPVIAFTPTVADAGATATAEITCSTPGTAIYYTVNGNDPTSSSTLYNNTFTLNDGDIVKAIAIKTTDATYWDNSDIASRTYTACSTTAPVITYAQSGSTANVTITAETGATIYYTTDGSDPSTSNYTGNGTTTVTFNGVATGTTVKAVAKNGTCQASAIVSKEIITSGVSGGVVTLYDYEDHNWSYYKASGDLPTGYPDELHSPDPRNVKITYKGNGQYTNGNAVSGVKVGVDADAHTFVYYKTLEKGADGKYAYTTIPNPFSVRPKSGNTYYGFSHWKVTSISGGTIDGSPTTINAETEIKFVPSGTYTTNCTSIEVVMEAVWDVAEVSTNGTFTQGYNSVERNFYVVSSSTNNNLPIVSTPCTYSSFYPNGTTDGTTAASLSNRNTRRSTISATADSKIEYIILYNNNDNTINAAGHNFTIGRGVSGYNGGLCATNLYGLGANATTSFKMRIESGTYTNLYFLGQGRNFTNNAKLTSIMGCDYDRAKVNGGDASFNQKLRVTADIALGMNGTTGNTSNKGAEVFNCTVKSGNFDLGTSNYGGAYQFYISAFGSNGTPYTYGKRTLIVEGGIFSDISGGMETDGVVSNDVRMVDIRIKGGTMNSAVYGAAQYSGAIGERRIIITGGTFLGWIAGGANGTKTDGGLLDGASYVYVGGNANVTSGNNTVINRAVGGNVFGAGCGYASNSSSGQVSLGTNVAIADNAIIERGVYGGGSYGYTTQTANIYILGGTVNCEAGGVNGTAYNANVNGGVYGGACQNRAGVTNVKVYGGTVNGGVYGGGNVSGDVAGPITVDVYGTDPQPASGYAIHQVFGGGNVAAYTGTPVVTVHNDSSCNISIGEVYGGGNQASVTGTNVTIEAGNIIGDVYGGGRQAPVGNGGTSVTINGGTIRRVFGGNNISGAIADGTAGKIAVNVNKTTDCPMKIGQVFGGGNQAGSQVGRITVGCTGDLVTPLADGERYGYDQEGIGAVYGGANEAAITGDITLNIVSGIVDSVFGGNNAGGAIDGDITVNINKNGSAPCANHWYVGYVFGGGNNATYSQKTADHPAVNVQAGLVTHHVFGGGNGSGATVTGNPTVTLSGTAQVGGNVFGGGNAAAVSGNTSVKLQN